MYHRCAFSIFRKVEVHFIAALTLYNFFIEKCIIWPWFLRNTAILTRFPKKTVSIVECGWRKLNLGWFPSHVFPLRGVLEHNKEVTSEIRYFSLFGPLVGDYIIILIYSINEFVESGTSEICPICGPTHWLKTDSECFMIQL